MRHHLEHYAQLLVDYCLQLKKNDRLLIQSTVLAEPLIREIYRFALRRGAHIVTDLEWAEQERIYYAEAQENQLIWTSPLIQKAFEEFEAYLYVRAPYNLREGQNIDPIKRKKRGEATAGLRQIYNERTAAKVLRRCLCQYPTQAAAQEAGMSLEEYEDFVIQACKLDQEDPAGAWMALGMEQQQIVDFLNKVKVLTFKNSNTDLTFRVEGRIWINSDGKNNMPSGEVFSSAWEDSADGYIHFDYPSIFRGYAVEGITLEFHRGEVVSWKAHAGQELLDEIFSLDGARRLGEVAIGTNYGIQRATRNILFDEKIGGSVHLAIGQTYLHTGGKNTSSIHWDMIADMKKDGEIWADGQKIYQNGIFLI